MLSALDLARRIEAGELTPATVVELCGEAIAARETELACFTALDIEAARRKAKSAGLAQMPLRGLPVGLKDIFDTVDFPTCYGTPIYAGHRSRSDAALVSQIRRAGGVVIGKTVTTPLVALDPADTRNPHNAAHTPGGSSSGSAAAVGAGMLPIAAGSQTGGSVIRPAAFCGIAGYKPSFALMPRVGMLCFSWSLDTVGLFAAGVDDVAFAAAAITGRALRVDDEAPAAPRIGVARTHLWPQARREMQAAVESAAGAAEAAGAQVKDFDLPAIFEDAWRLHPIIQDYEACRALAYEYDNHRDKLGPILRAQLDKAISITPDAYDEARRTATRARQIFAELMADTDVLLTPSAAGAAPRGLETTGNPMFNRLWTLLGPPCINVPGIVGSDGLPLGVQIVGRFARDRIALKAALFVEQAIAQRGK
jgi:Asp-tRNA(Asn)/Glu-tRNA(Gln) amidotransferase A subunit family amidase